MPNRPWWLRGAVIGLGAALAGVAAALFIGALVGRSTVILSDLGAAQLPHLLRGVTHLPAAVAYLVVHTVAYLAAGIVALAVCRLLDRVPAISTAVVFVVIILEFGFLVLTRTTLEFGMVDETTWHVLLAAHAVADLVFAAGVFAMHPSVRRDFLEGYEG